MTMAMAMTIVLSRRAAFAFAFAFLLSAYATTITPNVVVVEAMTRSTARNSRSHHRIANENIQQQRNSSRSFLLRAIIGRNNSKNNKMSGNGRTASECASTAKPQAEGPGQSVKSEKDEGIYTNKPVLRGQFHKWGAILYPPMLGLPLFARVASVGKMAAVAASTKRQLWKSFVLFSFAVESILVVSATLHTYKWKTERNFNICRKLDFTAIFVGIACFYSSMGKLLMGHHPYFWLLETLVWVCAGSGTLLKWKFPDAPPWANGGVFLVQGWAALPLVPALFDSCSLKVALGMFNGGVLVSLGAFAYILQWPKNTRNKPQRQIVFGPHEMFHVGTLCMIASFWSSMWVRVSELAVASATAATVAL